MICNGSSEMACGNRGERWELSKELVIVVIVSHLLLIYHFLDFFTKVLWERVVLL
jgi:hypothetical protein